MFRKSLLIILFIMVVTFPLTRSTSVLIAGISRQSSYDAAKSFAKRGSLDKALEIMTRLLAAGASRDEYIYFTALLEFKEGYRASCVKRCNRLLSKPRSPYNAKAKKLKELVLERNESIRNESTWNLTERGMSNSRVYSTALENHKQFVDSGFNNVAGRVAEARDRRTHFVKRKTVRDSNAFNKFLGRAPLNSKSSTQYVKAFPSSNDAAAAFMKDSGTRAIDESAQDSQFAEEDNESVGEFESAIEWDEAFKTADESKESIDEAPEKETRTTELERAESKDNAFPDFEDVPSEKVLEKPDKKELPSTSNENVNNEHMKPIPVSTAADGPKATDNSKSEAKEASAKDQKSKESRSSEDDFENLFGGFEEEEKESESKKEEAEKDKSKKDVDLEDNEAEKEVEGFDEAFEDFGNEESNKTEDGTEESDDDEDFNEDAFSGFEVDESKDDKSDVEDTEDSLDDAFSDFESTEEDEEDSEDDDFGAFDSF